MQNAIRTSKAAYDTLVRTLAFGNQTAKHTDSGVTTVEMLESAYATYKHSVPSEKTMHRTCRFYALPESELSDDDMLYGISREDAERALESALAGFAMPDGSGWFWQSENDPDLVVLRSWTKVA